MKIDPKFIDGAMATDEELATKASNTGTPDHVRIFNGSGVDSSEAQLAISRGGTGQSTANAALNALLPSQTGNAGKILSTTGSTSEWIEQINYMYESEAISATVFYHGKAAENSLTGSPVWLIKRLTASNDTILIEYADASQAYNKTWDDRATYTYS